jgi:hypothetical protein
MCAHFLDGVTRMRFSQSRPSVMPPLALCGFAFAESPHVVCTQIGLSLSLRRTQL